MKQKHAAQLQRNGPEQLNLCLFSADLRLIWPLTQRIHWALAGLYPRKTSGFSFSTLKDL